ncbi:MAG: rod shape-determining protein RodA [Fimbriimonadaceae bacterium]|jgi:cell division protein FtsW (lipid II flippase)|nr:rod shape-determining protein RodA [Fimbriimonadaceae bacterium]
MALRPEKSQKSRTDWWLLLSTGLLILAGFLAIYSVDHSRGNLTFLSRQLFFGVLGGLLYLLFKRIDLEWWRKAANPLYLFNIALLVSVHFLGREVNGSQRWIEIASIQFQPSELSKLLVPITLAAFFANRSEEIQSWRTLGFSFLHVLPTVGLLLAQPHMGGAISILSIWFVICLYSGVPWKKLGLSLAAGVTLFGLAAFTPLPLLQDYHKERLATTFNVLKGNEADRKGSFYQQNRSIIAIGTGGVNGVGFLNGEQKGARYIPHQQNDFIFSVVGEEGGLVGSAILLGLFLFFFYRVWLVGFLTRDPMKRMVSGGILAVLSVHTVINLLMVLGIGPVVGLWLPFLSYGGTALATCMAMIGLLDQPEPESA